ncbi:MAG: hypothetical protein QM489_02895 [Candidatus Izemoplasma sp.]
MEIKFNQELNREDYVEFVFTHMISNMFQPYKRVGLVISVVYLIISPLFMETYLFTIIGLGIMFFIIGLSIFLRRNAGKYYDNNSDQFRMTYTLTDTKFHYQNNDIIVDKMWSEFYSARESENILYIYVDKLRGIAVKKSDAGEEAITFIKNKLTENITKKRLIRFK